MGKAVYSAGKFDITSRVVEYLDVKIDFGGTEFSAVQALGRKIDEKFVLNHLAKFFYCFKVFVPEGKIIFYTKAEQRGYIQQEVTFSTKLLNHTEMHKMPRCLDKQEVSGKPELLRMIKICQDAYIRNQQEKRTANFRGSA